MMNTKIAFLFGTLGLFSVTICNAQTTDTRTANTSTPTNTNLPKPYETRSVYNFSKVIGWENGATPVAPEGFKVTKFGTGFKSPRWVYVLPNGDVLIAETKREPKGGLEKTAMKVIGMTRSESAEENANRITLLRDQDNDGVPEVQEIFLSDLNRPFGMVLVKGFLYVACMDVVMKFPYKEGDTKITAPGEKIFNLPTEGRHWTKNIIANKEGTKLYISIGSSSNVAEDGIENEKGRACILEINLTGTEVRAYAEGLRNPVGMAWMPGTNTMWTVVNERDELGDDLVPDYLTSVKEGGFYGWPYCYFGKNIDPRIKEKDKRPDLVEKTIVPEVDLGSHTASLGLAFYNKRSFPEKYINGAFIGQHGSWNRSTPSGYRVIFVPFKDGKAQTPEDFLSGFMINPKKNEVHGRPVGVAVSNDGSLLVADDAGNAVWRVSYSK